MQQSLFSSKTNEWATPQDFYDKLNDEFCFTLDPCATKENAKCKSFYTLEQDGLKQSWIGEKVFCNPPYGRQIKKWVEKAKNETDCGFCIVVMLIPARTDTSYWHENILNNPNAEIRFIRGRLKFGNGKNSAPFPSAVIIFKKKFN